ncbi:MAG: hypothetical protein JOY97_05730 [Hyphomicrobiales bacterium]|nr:hypothetical protein [Hyphomicrobiales bacterium]
MSETVAIEPPSSRRLRRLLLLALIGVVLGLAASFIVPHVMGLVWYVPRLERLFAQLRRDPVLIEALRGQNSALADKDEAWVLAQDRVWNEERLKREGGTLQRAVMDLPASRHLRDLLAESKGLVTHALLIDAKGRLAAEPFPSFNFKQFDKPKFQDTFPHGAEARHVSWLQLSWDGTHPVCWQARVMLDPATRAPIGVLALEVNYLKVGYFGCIEAPVHTARERATNRVSSEE